jgi:hypothetical protein
MEFEQELEAAALELEGELMRARGVGAEATAFAEAAEQSRGMRAGRQ